MTPIPVAKRSKVRVCGRLPAGIAGSNPTGGMDIYLLWVLCVVIVEVSVMETNGLWCVWVWSRKFDSEEAYAH